MKIAKLIIRIQAAMIPHERHSSELKKIFNSLQTRTKIETLDHDAIAFYRMI